MPTDGTEDNKVEDVEQVLMFGLTKSLTELVDVILLTNDPKTLITSTNVNYCHSEFSVSRNRLSSDAFTFLPNY